MEAEYLDDFVSKGGSAVRFVSGDEDALLAVRLGLASAAASRRFHFVQMDPGELNEDGKKPDFHRIENFFCHISATIEWQNLSLAQLVSALESRGIRFAPTGSARDYHEVANFNGLEPADLLNKYARLITDLHLRDLGMAVEFRVALTALGRAQLIPDEGTPTDEELLLGWLRGARAIPGGARTLKRFRILERIGRSNARFMLASLAHWLRQVGKNGIVVVFDFRPYELIQASRSLRDQMQLTALQQAVARGANIEELKAIGEAREEGTASVRYGKTAYIQALEQLRHLIDEIERLEGLALVVLGSRQFFDERPKLLLNERRFSDYNALQTRIGLEVHDTEHQNPSAALVHIGGS